MDRVVLAVQVSGPVERSQKQKLKFASSLDHLFVWFMCQEDGGQSSSG